MTEEQKRILRQMAQEGQDAGLVDLDYQAWYRDAVQRLTDCRARLDESRLMLEEAQASRERLLDVLMQIRQLCDEREERERGSLSRMHGGAPFPATLLVSEVLAILEKR